MRTVQNSQSFNFLNEKKIWASSTSGTHKIPILKEEEGREIYSNGILTSNTSNVTFRKYIIVTKLRPLSFSCWTLEIIDGDSRHYRWFIAELSEIWDEEARGRRRREGDATTRQLMVVSVVHVNEGNDIVVLATISWRWRLHLPLLICHQISQKISNSTALCMRWKTKIMCGIDNLSSAQMRVLTKIKKKGIDHRVFGRLT